jgi:hypothetical protein
VWSHKGPTLKGIRYCNDPDTELCFPGSRSNTFWTGLIVPLCYAMLWHDHHEPCIWCNYVYLI